jgi:chemotaxis protein CheD
MCTLESSTLVQRMQRAGERAAAARAVTPAPAASGPLPGAVWQLAAKPGEEVFLMPGQLHFGDHAGSLKTLLGSCVAITLWHPVRRLGGMCHYLLPGRARTAGSARDGRYGDEAMEVLLEHIERAATAPHEYQAHLYGGADTLPEGTRLRFNVGERNIEAGWHFIDRCGFQLLGVDVGEDVPRSVCLHLATGEVDMRRGQGRAPPMELPSCQPMPPPYAPGHQNRGRA